MIILNLKAENDCQQAIKTYLEQNVSNSLAEKINGGAEIEKDGKSLINKKTLTQFWIYATKKALEMKTSYVANDTVFGWAIHYFEESSIIGTLYNKDGTEYKPATNPTQKSVQHVPAPSIFAKPIPSKPRQYNLFDMLTQSEMTQAEDTKQEKIETPVEKRQDNNVNIASINIDMGTGEILSSQNKQPQGSSLYQKYMYFQNKNPQAVIAYRLGDFFEIIGDNAIEISNRLNLTLTERDCGLSEPVLMIGFPYHACDKYFRKIAEFSQLIVVDGDVSTHYVLAEKTSNNTPVTIDSTPTCDDELDKERELQQFFDKDALCLLYELFDYKLDMQ